MAFTVTIGSGIAIIPCGNPTARSPYTTHHFLLPPLVSTGARRKVHVARAEKVPSRYDDWLDNRPGQEPDFWEGEQWDLLGFFVKYTWILGFAVAASVALYGCFTFHEPSKKVKEAAEKMYSVDSSQVFTEKPSQGFEEPDAYDSDVFDSNPTEVAPSLE